MQLIHSVQYRACIQIVPVYIQLSERPGTSRHLLKTSGLYKNGFIESFRSSKKSGVKAALIICCRYTGLFEMTVRVWTTCHTQYTWDRRICFFLFNRTTLKVFVTYLTGALYVHPLWFYRHHHNNQVCSACQRWWFQWRFWFVSSVPGYKGCTYRAPVRYVTKTWSVVLLIKKTHILLSQVYRVWQVFKTATIILNNPVYIFWCVMLYGLVDSVS